MSAPSTLRVRVARKQQEAQDICSFELISADAQTLPSFSAGSHIDLHLPGGLTRQYSLCNDPSEGHRYLICVLREDPSRGGSAALHDTVAKGARLEISPPRNHFALAHEARRHLLLAAGIGVTPILCMAERLATLGADFQMHYAARSRARAAFHDRILASSFAPRVAFHFGDGPAAQRIDIAAVLASPAAGTHLYVCGPERFMNEVLAQAHAAGWPQACIHHEYFGAEVKALADDGSFEVQIASSGRIVEVGAAQTVLAALAEAGVVVPSSCEQGVCGTCLTRVITGTPDHRDQYLTPEEQAAGDQFMPCCSRALTPRLVLDL